MLKTTVLAGLLTTALAVGVVPASAEADPVPPCLGPDFAPTPAYAPLGAQPSVSVWRNVSLDFGGACPGVLDGPASLVIALSGRFHNDGTLEALAARIGAVSTLEGLPYWSVSDRRWRPLISVSYAIESPALTEPRPDFTAADVLSGRTLYMAQRDTRSHGLNIYALEATSPSVDQLIVTTTNHTGIRFLLATLFEPQALVSTVVFTRIRGDQWGYFGLTVVREGVVRSREASFINRAAALQRFFTGQRPDAEPPLSP